MVDSAVELVVDEVSLASALAKVAWADATEACAVVTAALSVVTSSEASVCPAVTLCPTDTSMVLTVPEASKLRSA